MGRHTGTRYSKYGRDKAIKSVERKPIRPLERQRMRPWLMDILDRKSCAQLTWLNKREKKFRVAWKHAAGQNWDMGQDACLFELWARHTGKFYDGDKPNPKKWKANFRCALNSLPDVEQDRCLGIKRGLNAFKVYRFLDEKKQKLKKTHGSKSDDSEDDDYESDGSSDYEAEWTPLPRALRQRRTKSRLNSEGSGDCSSPSHCSSDSDIGDCSVPDTSFSKTTSPLPHFDQIIPQHVQQSMHGSFLEARPAEAHSLQVTSSEDDDTTSTSSSGDAAQLIELFFTDDCDLDTLMTQSEEIRFAGDEEMPLIFYDDPMNEEGPSVIVQSTDGCTQDWKYTSLNDL